MILKRLKLYTGFAEPTNCYIVQDEKSKETIVIDPGAEPEKIIDMLNILEAKLKYIYLTHCHADHIGADNLHNNNVNLANYVCDKEILLEADSRIDDNDLIHIGKIEFRVIHTPGHTIGSTSLYCAEEKMLFSGDTLFRGTWGRTDLPTSDFESIIKSITNRLLVLPDDTIVYPGHGKSTMIKEEKPIYLELKPRLD